VSFLRLLIEPLRKICGAKVLYILEIQKVNEKKIVFLLHILVIEKAIHDEIFCTLSYAAGRMEIRRSSARGEKSRNYICPTYIQLGFRMGRIGFFEPGDTGIYPDEEGIFLFSLGCYLTDIAGDSRGQGKQGEPFGGPNGTGVQ
jgi:hypothetical protein